MKDSKDSLYLAISMKITEGDIQLYPHFVYILYNKFSKKSKIKGAILYELLL